MVFSFRKSFPHSVESKSLIDNNISCVAVRNLEHISLVQYCDEFVRARIAFSHTHKNIPHPPATFFFFFSPWRHWGLVRLRDLPKSYSHLVTELIFELSFNFLVTCLVWKALGLLLDCYPRDGITLPLRLQDLL